LTLVNALRLLRVLGKQALKIEPVVRRRVDVPLEYHGTATDGWQIVAGSLHEQSVVVDVGLGEDTAFPESLIRTYGCTVSGFDPTPRAIAHVRRLGDPHMRIFELGVAAVTGKAQFFLPIDGRYVSGSLTRESHLGATPIEVEFITIGQIFTAIDSSRIDLLKLDIEGAEFDVIASPEFEQFANSIDQLCVEFHHRWKSRGKRATDEAVKRLSDCGFQCVWYSRTTNEEFTFVRRAVLSSLLGSTRQ
jgi:FkbM family methyltransferase